ncbi:MAG: glutathione S-transferase family protein [Pseudomonadota bacterium]
MRLQLLSLKLYVAPGTCARVPTIALEEIGVPFETELVRTAANQQNSLEFLKLNPKGKVPTLLIDDKPLTENVAILSWLNNQFPEAGLLPKTTDPIELAKQTADLSFFSATVHPTVTRIAMPVKFIADSELSFELVRPKGTEAMLPIMKMINDRLEDGPWWYGDQWSVVDGYLFWVWWRITGVGFSDAAFPNIKRHLELSNQRPAVQRAMAREAEYIEVLKSEGNFRAPR